MRRLRSVLPLLLCACAAHAALAAPQTHVGEYDPADVQRGLQLYSTRCTTCHGEAGTQVPGVALLSGSFRRAASDEALAGIIKGGIAGTGMPQGNYNEAELRGLVAYLRTANRIPGEPAASLARGDSKRGEALFKGKGQCDGCHRLGPNGGFRGPNLSEIGATRTDQSLMKSLVDPSAEITPLNQELRIVTRTGQTIVGRRMNEDTYSVQLILQEQGRLLALMKSDIREMAPVKTSPMPSFRGHFSDSELADLVAYLRTLRPAE